MGAELHGVAGVEQDREETVGLAAIALEIQLLAAGVDVPVDVAKIVAGSIGLIFGELLAEAEVGRAVQTGDEAIDDGLRDQIETGDACEDGGIEKALQRTPIIDDFSRRAMAGYRGRPFLLTNRRDLQCG
jgi:hypothetical protein